MSKDTNTQPGIKSSFQYRGETILVDRYDVKDMSELPDVKWQQVYAVGSVNSKVSVVHYADSEVHNLPGGEFDEPG